MNHRQHLEDTVALYQWLLSHTEDRKFNTLRIAASHMAKAGMHPGNILRLLSEHCTSPEY